MKWVDCWLVQLLWKDAFVVANTTATKYLWSNNDCNMMMLLLLSQLELLKLFDDLLVLSLQRKHETPNDTPKKDKKGRRRRGDGWRCATKPLWPLLLHCFEKKAIKKNEVQIHHHCVTIRRQLLHLITYCHSELSQGWVKFENSKMGGGGGIRE